MKIAIKQLTEEAKIPGYATEESAGADLYALEQTVILPGEKALIHTGVAVEIPKGYAGFIYARSGLATKRDLAPANMVGVIDSDYRGELMVSLRNYGKATQTVEKHERVAQLVISPVVQADFFAVDSLGETHRGEGGFGSTGQK